MAAGINPVLQTHAQIVKADKSARVKLITLEFVQELHKIDEDFKAFSSTGIAARVSNLTSVYSMYVNTLDRNP